MPLQLEEELLQAVGEARSDDVAALLETGADPNAGLFRDESALSIAVRNGREEILDLLLHRAPMCCMKEGHGDVQRHPPARVRYMLRLKDLVLHIVKFSLATYAVCILAMSLPPGSLQTLGLYGSHYLWFTYNCSRVSFYSRISLQRRYLSSWTYVDTLLSMGVTNWINVFFIRQTLRVLVPPMLPPLPDPIPSPTYLQDLAVALPLRFSIDVMVTVICKLLTRVGLIKSERPLWEGTLLSIHPERWRSPAERVLESVLASESVTEAMVLKLLRADTLASRPYERSEVARRLFKLAVDKCWPELTKVPHYCRRAS